MNPKTELPIGIFDSGIGGLTVVRQIHRALPHEDLVYLGDTARVPYGTKSPGTVVRFACEDTQFLIQQNVKAVVVACNTVSAWALPTLERKFGVPIFGVIIPGAQAALKKTKNRRIGIIGTTATVRSQAYSRTILARDDAARVFARACPLLVPLVEEGWTNQRVTLAVLIVSFPPSGIASRAFTARSSRGVVGRRCSRACETRRSRLATRSLSRISTRSVRR